MRTNIDQKSKVNFCNDGNHSMKLTKSAQRPNFLEIVIKEYERNPLDCVQSNFMGGGGGAGVVVPSLPPPLRTTFYDPQPRHPTSSIFHCYSPTIHYPCPHPSIKILIIHIAFQVGLVTNRSFSSFA